MNFHQEWYTLHSLYDVLGIIKRTLALMVHTNGKENDALHCVGVPSVHNPRMRPNLSTVLLKWNAELRSKLILLLSKGNVTPLQTRLWPRGG